jgi:hypothetical protein
MGRGALTSVGRTLVASAVFPYESSGSCCAKFFASPIFSESLPVRAPVLYRGPPISETLNRMAEVEDSMIHGSWAINVTGLLRRY